MSFPLAYIHLTLDHSKGPDQGHEHFDNEYLESGDIKKKYFWHHIQSYVWGFDWCTYIWPWHVSSSPTTDQEVSWDLILGL